MKTVRRKKPARSTAVLLVAALLATGSLSEAQTRFFTLNAGAVPCVRIVEDFDRDGYSDLLVGSPFYSGTRNGQPFYGGRVALYSGRDLSIIHEFYGKQSANDWFGWSVAMIADLNKDGYPEILVGIPQGPGKQNPSNIAGQAHVYSGKDGSRLFTFYGATSSMFGLAVVSPGDLNKDGFADVLVGAPYRSSTKLWQPGSVRAISTETATRTSTLERPSTGRTGLSGTSAA
jgi:hypothetical protein